MRIPIDAAEKPFRILGGAGAYGSCDARSRRATERPAGVLDRTSRSAKERNAADMPESAASVEAS